MCVAGQGCSLGSKAAQGTVQPPWLSGTRSFTSQLGRAAGFDLCWSRATGWALFLGHACWIDGLEVMLNNWAGVQMHFPALAGW